MIILIVQFANDFRIHPPSARMLTLMHGKSRRKDEHGGCAARFSELSILGYKRVAGLEATECCGGLVC